MKLGRAKLGAAAWCLTMAPLPLIVVAGGWFWAAALAVVFMSFLLAGNVCRAGVWRACWGPIYWHLLNRALVAKHLRKVMRRRAGGRLRRVPEISQAEYQRQRDQGRWAAELVWNIADNGRTQKEYALRYRVARERGLGGWKILDGIIIAWAFLHTAGLILLLLIAIPASRD